MAMAADSPPTASSGNGSQSPQFQPSNLRSPWVQVVLGESEALHPSKSSPSQSSPLPEQSHFSDPKASLAMAAVDCLTESSDISNSGAVNSRKAAWNKHSNGSEYVSHVVDAVSWPALSEAARVSPKSASDPRKNVPDVSISVPQGAITQVSPRKHSSTSTNVTSTPNIATPTRQKSMKRGASFGGGPSRSSFAQPSMPLPLPPPPPPPFPVFSMPQNNYGNFVPVLPDLASREPFRGSNQDSKMGGIGSQLRSPVPNGHPGERNSSRRGNFGPQNRSKSFGARLEHNTGHYEWNSPHPSTTRDAHVQPQRAPPRGFMSPPLNTTAFITPQHVRPFATPMGIPDLASPVYVFPALPPDPFGCYPFIPHPTPSTMPFPVPEPSLPTLLVNQIDYYFSDANLVKDEFLKSNMDEKGWVPITLIASFRRVQNLTNNIQSILDALKYSTVVEVQGEKVRKRVDWIKWAPTSTNCSSQSLDGSYNDTLASCFKKVTLDEVTKDQKTTMGKVVTDTEEVQGKCSSGNLPCKGMSTLSNGAVTN